MGNDKPSHGHLLKRHCVPVSTLNGSYVPVEHSRDTQLISIRRGEVVCRRIYDVRCISPDYWAIIV